jgi:hypothetical protein
LEDSGKMEEAVYFDKVCQHISELPNTEFNYNSFGITEAVAHF